MAVAIHQRGATSLVDTGFGRRTARWIEEAFDLRPLLTIHTRKDAEDGATKWVLEARDGHRFEVVAIPNRGNWTVCLSSQVGCGLACTFCATGKVGLIRDLTAGEITESLVIAERERGIRATDVVFMGQGEPLHAYESVMTAATNLNDDLGHRISRRRITVSTSGLVPEIHRYTDERRPWRLHLSLHSAVQETRERLMPIARSHRLPELIEAFRRDQRERQVKWVTLQYVALPGVNLDDDHVDALGRELAGLRYILNVIPWNEFSGVPDGGFRAPTWAEVKDFTTRLRRLDCPVKIRYSAGKRDGMGCGQLSADTFDVDTEAGHMATAPGIFSPRRASKVGAEGVAR